jgi:hypothetical protein
VAPAACGHARGRAGGHHLWAERYDRDLNDIFGVQDEIARKVAVVLKEILTEGRHMDVASQRITDKLWLGALPAEAPVKVRPGFGSGLACDGCDEMTSSSQPEHAVEMPDGNTLRFHVPCAGV